MRTEPEEKKKEVSPSALLKEASTKFFVFIVLGISFILILSHFTLFQVRHPTEIGTIMTDIVILVIITVMLFETHHLSKSWRCPFAWINVGIFLFFIGSLSEFLGEFFIKPSFLKYAVENGFKIFSFGILAWGFFQWGKERLETRQKMEKLKQIDGLTNLPTRSSFHQKLRRYERIAQRYMDPFSVIYLNIDNFREYNQNRGENAGDVALKKVAALLCQNVRKEDLVFRYGGDEFMILIPVLRKENGEQIADKLKVAVENEFKNEGLTVSVAVIFYELKRNVLQELKETMHSAKAAGKNRVCLAE